MAMTVPSTSPSGTPQPVAEPLLRLEGIDTFYGSSQVHFALDLAVGRRTASCASSAATHRASRPP